MSDAVSLSSTETLVVPLVLALTRASSFIIAAPMLGRGIVPNVVKMGFCLALTSVLIPHYAEVLGRDSEGTRPHIVVAVLMEFVVGVALGYLIRLVLLPTRIAGSYIGQELGFNLGQVADPTTGSTTNEAGMLMDAFGLLVFWVTNTHHAALRMLTISVGSLRGDQEFIDAFTMVAAETLSSAHELGIMMVSPLASVLFLVLLYLGVAMRAWPQVTLFSFGMGARLLIGLAAFFFLMPLILFNMAQIITGLTESMSGWVMPGF